jgi:hypothetical protein
LWKPCFAVHELLDHTARQAEQGAFVGQDEMLDHDALRGGQEGPIGKLFSADLEPQWNPSRSLGSQVSRKLLK